MPEFKCYPWTDPRANWMYCPSFGAAVTFTVFFGLSTIVHIAQATIYKKPFAFVICMGAAWECAGYIVRTLSVVNQLNPWYAFVQLLLILLAPLWINAFIYMVLGRAIHFFLENDRIFNIRARRITLMFVLFDFAAFLIQVIGGSMTSSQNPIQTQKLGLHIYMGGVGLQLLFIAVFITLAVQFHGMMYSLLKIAGLERPSLLSFARKAPKMRYNNDGSSEEGYPVGVAQSQAYNSPDKAIRLLYVVYTVLLLIIFRNIYRLIEFSQGVTSSITKHEWYAYFFDALPMLSALIILSIFYPGKILQGPRSDFSEENKEIKAAKKAKKQAKREGSDQRKAEKILARIAKKEQKSTEKSIEKAAKEQKKEEKVQEKSRRKEEKKAAKEEKKADSQTFV